MKLQPQRTPASLKFFSFFSVEKIWQVSVTVLSASMVMASGCAVTGASAQTAVPVGAPTASAAAVPDTVAVPDAPVVPKYSAADIKTIFSYLDRNGDGKISKEEAASFKGVARNFDRADTNKDGMLSLEEFEFAMNRAK